MDIVTIGQIAMDARASFVLIATLSRREKWAPKAFQRPLFRRS
jgi:hypothetical protein